MFGLKRWRKRRRNDADHVDEQTRRANETYRAEHDGLIMGRSQPAADRWQRHTDDEFKRP